MVCAHLPQTCHHLAIFLCITTHFDGIFCKFAAGFPIFDCCKDVLLVCSYRRGTLRTRVLRSCEWPRRPWECPLWLPFLSVSSGVAKKLEPACWIMFYATDRVDVSGRTETDFLSLELWNFPPASGGNLLIGCLLAPWFNFFWYVLFSALCEILLNMFWFLISYADDFDDLLNLFWVFCRKVLLVVLRLLKLIDWVRGLRSSCRAAPPCVEVWETVISTCLLRWRARGVGSRDLLYFLNTFWVLCMLFW